MGITFNPSTLLNGAGIDVASVVSQIQAQSSGELSVWQNEQATLTTQAGDLSSLNSDLTNLSNAVNALTDITGALTAMTANSSWPAIVTGTADSTAIPATHTVVVSTLASSGTVYTGALTDANTSVLPSNASSGDLQLQVGGSGGKTYDIPINQTLNDTTISTLASYINQQSTANQWGVTASVLNDSTGSRLSITSQATGTDGALAITSNTTSDANGDVLPNTPTNLSFQTPVCGTNASFTVDGIPFSSTTNTVVGAITGVTLNLISGDSATPVQVAVTPDVTQATQAVNNFVSAYNTVITDINNQYALSASTGQQGPLASDSALSALQTSLMTDITYAVSGANGPINLASFGINMNNDGTLTVGSNASGQTLAQIISANPTSIQNFFQMGISNSFGANLRQNLLTLTDPTKGILNADLAQNTATQKSLSSQIADFQDRLASQKQLLTQQFNQVNAALEEYPYLLQAVNAELNYTSGLWNGSNASNSNSSTSGS